MYRKPLYKMLFAGCASLASGWWTDLRFFWYTKDKGLLIFIVIAGVVVIGLGALVQSVFTQKDDRQNLTCLALNVYFEARGESKAGQHAVAEVTMNRVASGRYPKTVCAVVYQQNWDALRKRYVGAFSWTEFDVRETPSGKEWQRAWEAAETIYYGRETPTLNGALHYHAVYIKPSWSRDKEPVARIGKHVFYK